MLYRATKDDRYLKQAQRMAEFFTKFDALPIDHSHGNLSAWRGILQLYEITGDRKYLDRARAKWDLAVKGGYRLADRRHRRTMGRLLSEPAKRAARPIGCGFVSTCGGSPAKHVISMWPIVCFTTSIPSASAKPAATAICTSTATLPPGRSPPSEPSKPTIAAASPARWRCTSPSPIWPPARNAASTSTSLRFHVARQGQWTRLASRRAHRFQQQQHRR